MLTTRPLIVFVLIISALAGISAHAQIRSGTITGKVSDQNGQLIPNAEVLLTNTETGITLNSASNSEGEYTFTYLQAGRYSVVVKPTAGFSEYQQSNIQVGTAETIRIDITLQPAGFGSLSLEVTDNGLSQLQTERSDVNSAVNELIIKNVPNINHNPLAFTTLLPNVVGRGSLYDQSDRQFGVGTESRIRLSAVSVNGGAAFTNDIQLDGVSTQGSSYNEASVIPTQEGLREVRVISNNFSAEYGRGQGVLTLTTKSGTNEFHGSLFGRIRNEALNANSFRNNHTPSIGLPYTPRQKFRPLTYGGTIGGPIYLPRFGEGGPALWSGKNRAFFFFSYEGLNHKESIDIFRRVPTVRERMGDFSETYVEVNQLPERIRLFDPFRVRPSFVGANNDFTRAEIPNAIITNPNPIALAILNSYPLPNRAPDNGDPRYNRRNYYKRIDRTFDRNNINSRVDYSFGNHSLYTTFGIQKGLILRPRSWDDNNLYDNNDWVGNNTSDNNPYGAIGTTFVLSPSLIMDVRYGVNRMNAKEQVLKSPGFDFNALGIPASIQAIMPSFDYAPDILGLGPFTDLSHGPFRRKQENATNHVVNGSVTKTVGKWTLKAGGEYRVYLSNYEDFKEGSLEITSNPALTAQYINATGGAINNPDRRTQGLGAASFLLGTGNLNITRGFSLRTTFAQKYLALYSQNDWKATDRLTINLGLRWDLQPGPTDRFNHMSSLDSERKNPFGGMGYVAFPGTEGYSRNLWDTKYTDFGPRLGAAYRIGERTVIRGGYGITYLPSNTGYFAGPSAYGMGSFTNGLDPSIYGRNPNGVPVGTWNSLDVNNIVYGTGTAQVPQLYGAFGTRLFDRKNWVSGRVHQWNAVIERNLGHNWLVSLGYSASKGTKMPFSRIPLNSRRYLPASLLNSWQATYRSTGNDPGDAPVTNPYNPNGTIPFNGLMRNRTIPYWLSFAEYPMFGTFDAGQGGGGVNRSIGSSDYHAGTVRASRRFADGWQVDAHYTWSKSLDNTQSEAMGLIANETIGFIDFIDPTRLSSYRKISVTDVPHRFVVSFAYDLPFNKGGMFYINNKFLRNIVGGWRIAGAGMIQSGFPIEIRPVSNGSLNLRPIRVPDQPLELPKSYQRWYNSRNPADRTVTLPSGRKFTVCERCYLKYNPDAFKSGQTIEDPRNRGRYITDRYWFGDAAYTYNEIRTERRNNWDISLSRSFALGENTSLEIAADAQNIFNHTQFGASAIGRDLGGPNLNLTDPNGTPLGASTDSNFGSIRASEGTYSPRQIEIRIKLSF
jgi:trimeric autotransporter adhesin